MKYSGFVLAAAFHKPARMPADTRRAFARLERASDQAKQIVGDADSLSVKGCTFRADASHLNDIAQALEDLLLTLRRTRAAQPRRRRRRRGGPDGEG